MSRRSRAALALLVAGLTVLFAVLAVARHHAVHNRTFDLALYARMAWGFVHGDPWDPILNASAFGLHLSPVLLPIGLVGRLVGTAPALLVAQAAGAGLAAFWIAGIGERRAGPFGAFFGAAAFLLHPNLGHVLTYEAHPGTLALAPLALLADAIDRRSPRRFAVATIGVLACREDLALVVVLAAMLVARDDVLRRTARRSALAAAAWLVLFAAVLHPLLAPANGSLEAHFGRWGASTGAVLLAWLTHPLDVLAHLAETPRLSYPLRVLLPLGFLPLAAPRWLLPTLPILAVNLMSDFPTTTSIESHYLTPALPWIVVGALSGFARLRARFAPRSTWRAGLALVPSLALGVSHFVEGGTPIARAFDAPAFVADETTRAGRRALAAVPEDASVQAPEPLLAHLAERSRLHRPPPPERITDFVIFDVSHRTRYARTETLLRTSEEPFLRAWLARDDHALVVAESPYFVFERGRSPREGLGGRAIVATNVVEPARVVSLTACLDLVSAIRRGGDRVELIFHARAACAGDLAVRLGAARRPRRVDLLFDGRLSPSQLRAGDLARSEHDLPELAGHATIHVGLLRSSGARPDPGDPTSVEIPIEEE